MCMKVSTKVVLDQRCSFAALGISIEQHRQQRLTEKDDDLLSHGLELSDKETFLIGSIVAQWGTLEYEIFNQTLMTFVTPEGVEPELPKEMQNLQFSSILKLWKERVVDKTEGERGDVLREQYDYILKMKQYRDALVHGMWEWSKDDLERISSIRIRKKEILTYHFTASDLADMDLRLGKINFKIMYPGGLEDMTEFHGETFSYVSRRFLAEITNSKVANDWISTPIIPNNADQDQDG